MKTYKKTYPVGRCKMTQWGWVPVEDNQEPTKQDNTVLYLYIVIIIICAAIGVYAFSVL